ncbi:hypothetical protein [Chryseobacterium profundimaris]|uniref:Type II toxin-antitoxin system RelE/ParE family toxin n=1 Tax=Chryseobacterium profundimaris TaxID=1387275 RepID=A0ABY1NTB1_9FLAO|nr:hypothetical protein [Chryseobacterium profundimaris]SMP17392.1 hypothetical protein SAMN06264346_104126 [Chryseobacterium profundimaris]
MRIIFSKVANERYENILEFISQTWTEKEIGVFIDEAEKVIFFDMRQNPQKILDFLQ